MHAFFDATVLPLYQRFVQEEEERRAKEVEIGHAEAHKPRELKVAIISHGCGLRFVHTSQTHGPSVIVASFG
jgi:hypothetical protein